MGLTHQWRKDPGSRLIGSRDLDRDKVQAPCIVRLPSGGFRLFYTGVGPAKPFPACQGYLLSAISGDGLEFRPEPGIRLAPRPEVAEMSLRVLAPTVTQTANGLWRMYFEARGPADRPTVIRSAISRDLLQWEHEEGIRLQGLGGLGGPRYLSLPDGRGRLYCFGSEYDEGGLSNGKRIAQGVVSGLTTDGLNFEFETGYRLQEKEIAEDTIGITAAEVIPPRTAGDGWSMVFSAWQDVPPGREVPIHPSGDPAAVESGLSEDFAAASIAADMAGYRSRIYVAHSSDGLAWGPATCVIDGAGYGGDGPDAVHAEDMSLVEIGAGCYRIYYAACDKDGNWGIASAVTFEGA